MRRSTRPQPVRSSTTACGAFAAALEAFAAQEFSRCGAPGRNLGGDSDVGGRGVRGARGCALHRKRDPHFVAQQPIKKQLLENCADRLLAHAMLQLSG